MVFNKTDKYLDNKEIIDDVFDIEYEDNSLKKLKSKSYFSTLQGGPGQPAKAISHY